MSLPAKKKNSAIASLPSNGPAFVEDTLVTRWNEHHFCLKSLCGPTNIFSDVVAVARIYANDISCFQLCILYVGIAQLISTSIGS